MGYILENQSTGEVLRGRRPPRFPLLHFLNIDQKRGLPLFSRIIPGKWQIQAPDIITNMRLLPLLPLLYTFYLPLYFIALLKKVDKKKREKRIGEKVAKVAKGPGKGLELSRSLLVR